MALNTSQLATASRLLDEALELDAAQRERWLAGLAAEHAELVPVLRQMLARQDAGEDYVLDRAPRLPLPEDGTAPIGAGDTVGPYRLVREIGRGGMGTVWLAERSDGTFERQVALKLPRIAWTEGLAQRMAREQRISARLEHPAIARLYDAGLDALGRPFIAMEYIDGVAIDQYVSAQRLDTAATLRLMLPVIRAVAYAHGRLVIHRDLKPANVLIDAAGQAHLMDFGIAKLLQGGEDSALTQEYGRALTPRYAAPEQITGDSIGVQSDVYSLGVMLYELLTGASPYAPARTTPGALEQAILQGPIAPPSSRVAEAGRARPLKGEIDAIVGKALKREPAERYATADALADDIERHLAGMPVRARPDSALYRLRKAVRRHWVAVSASTAALVIVLTTAGVAVFNAQRATRAAERERIVKEFVADVFRVNVPAPTAPGELRSASNAVFLEHSAQLVQARFANQPALQAELYAVVGGSFAAMGASRLAGEYAVRRLQALQVAGASADERARALLQAAAARLDDRRYGEAEQALQQALDHAKGNVRLRTDAEVLLARVLVASDRFAAATQLLEALEARIGQRRDGYGVADAWVQALRARMLLNANQREQALAMLDQAIARAMAVDGPDSLAAVEMRLIAARTLARTVYVERASAYFEPATAALTRLGNEYKIRAVYEAGRFAAERYLTFAQVTAQEALAALSEARRQVAASGRPLPADMSMWLDFDEGNVQWARGNGQAALPLIERSAPALFAAAANAEERRVSAGILGSVLMDSGKHELADRWLRAALQARIDQGQGMHPFASGGYGRIAKNLAMQGRYAEALAVLDSMPTFPPISGEGTSLPNRYNLHREMDRSWILALRGDFASALKTFPYDLLSSTTSGESAYASEILGEILCGAGRPREGLPHLEIAMREWEKQEYEHSPWLAHLRATAGLCALQLGDRRRALAWARQARASFTAQPDVSPFFKAPLTKLEKALGIRSIPTPKSEVRRASRASMAQVDEERMRTLGGRPASIRVASARRPAQVAYADDRGRCAPSQRSGSRLSKFRLRHVTVTGATRFWSVSASGCVRIGGGTKPSFAV